MSPVSELEMAINATFSSILNEIQFSNLNFAIQVTPFAAYITLKKSVQKDLNGLLATPSPPVLEVLHKTHQENLRLQNENAELKSEIYKFQENSNNVSHENGLLADSLEESIQTAAALKATNNILNDKILKAEIDASKLHAENIELEASLKQAKKRYDEVQKELEIKVRNLVKSIKLKEKETHNLNKNLENARATIKSLKSESSILKTSKTTLESEVRKLKRLQSDSERKKKKEPLRAEKRDENENIKKLDEKGLIDDANAISSAYSSMVSHCNPNKIKEIQSSFSLPSMNTHIQRLPQEKASPIITKDSFNKNSRTCYENIELEEKPEGFIGPRLPRMLTEEECKALFKRLLGDKYG